MITDAQPTKLNDSVSHGCIRDCEHLRVHHDSAKPLIYKNISNIVHIQKGRGMRSRIDCLPGMRKLAKRSWTQQA